MQARGVQSAVMSHMNVPWKLNPPIFSGGSSDHLSFRKEALVFAEYAGFRDVLTRQRDVPVADSSISAQQMRNQDCTKDEIDLHRKAYQFLRSTLKTRVDVNRLYRARCPAEALLVNLESWYNLQTLAPTQPLPHRFQCFTMRPGKKTMFVLTTLEEMAAQPMQQNFAMTPNQALTQLLSIPPDFEYEIEKRTVSNRLHLDREKVSLAIRTIYENVESQRCRNGVRRDAVTLFFLMRESRSSAGNIITCRVLSDAGEEWDEEKKGVVVGKGKGKGSMVAIVLTHRTATGKLTRHPQT